MSEATRRYFGTDGIRGKANRFPLTAGFAVRFGQAVAEIFLERRGDSRAWPVAVVGKDTRQSGDMLESAVAAGIASRGIDVRLAGVVPTPAVSLLVREEAAAFGVVVSASHNPFDDNGLKLFGPDGSKLDDALETAIEARLAAGRGGEGETAEDAGPVGRIAALPKAAERYVAFVRASAGGDGELLRGLRIALDAANGAASETSEEILRSLGARVSAAHHHPNGLNINLGCGCTHPEAIEALVRETGADVGVSHDGDADRVLLCDETGSVLDGDEIMAIAALSMIRAGTLRDKTLVATVMSNGGLDEAVRAAGGKVLRAGVGDRYVLEAMRGGGYNLGGEQSGHFVFADHNATGDGALAAVQVLRMMRESGLPLSELRRAMRKLPQAQRSVRVRERRALEGLAAADRVARLEQALGEAGRVLVRYSGTEPLLRILVEGPDAAFVEAEAEALARAVAEEIGT
jgi:phosphoglucosamine mutase